MLQFRRLTLFGFLAILQSLANVAVLGSPIVIEGLLVSVGVGHGYGLGLGARQTGGGTGGLNIPPDCQSTCSPIIGPLSSQQCKPEDCCTAEFGNGLRDCLLCIGTVMGLQDYSQPQQTLDRFTASCAAQGHTMPSLTLPGQDNNRASSSFNPSTMRPTQQTVTSLPATTTSDPEPTQTGSGSNGAMRLQLGGTASAWVIAAGFVGGVLLG